jgi:hypothetical protein
MNGIAKRKKLQESFSKYGLNECCCECDPLLGHVLATNLNSPDGTLDLTPYKKSGGNLTKWAIRFASWGYNLALYNDIVSGELIGLPDTFNFGDSVNMDSWKKIYFELIVGCDTTPYHITCVPMKFCIPGFFESGSVEVHDFLNRDFSAYIGFTGWASLLGDFDIGCDGKPVWFQPISIPEKPIDMFYQFYNVGSDCGYT